MRVHTTLTPARARAAVLVAAEAEGFRITLTAPYVEAELVETRGNNIRVQILRVTFTEADDGTEVTANGQGDAYLAGRRVLRTLP